MFLKSIGLAFDQERVHTAKITTGKNSESNVVEIQAVELITDTWHQDVTDPAEVQQCLSGVTILKEAKAS